jgi:hypothetical protein
MQCIIDATKEVIHPLSIKDFLGVKFIFATRDVNNEFGRDASSTQSGDVIF